MQGAACPHTRARQFCTVCTRIQSENSLYSWEMEEVTGGPSMPGNQEERGGPGGGFVPGQQEGLTSREGKGQWPWLLAARHTRAPLLVIPGEKWKLLLQLMPEPRHKHISVPAQTLEASVPGVCRLMLRQQFPGSHREMKGPPADRRVKETHSRPSRARHVCGSRGLSPTRDRPAPPSGSSLPNLAKEN